MLCCFCLSLLTLITPGGLTGQPASNDTQATPAAITYRLERPGQVSLAIFDTAGRQVRTVLTGERQEAGRHTVTWDGLDRNGNSVAPGTYEWRVLRTPGFTRHFLVNVGTNPTWSAFDLWPGNHAGPTMVMVDREGDLYVGSVSAEGPPHLLKLSLDGRRKYWDTRNWWLQDGTIGVVRIEDALFFLDCYAHLWIWQADPTLGPSWSNPQRYKFTQQRIPFADLLHSGEVRSKSEGEGNRAVSPMCMAAGKDFLVVTYEKHDEVRFLWPGIGKILRTQSVRVSQPKGVAIAPDGRVFVVSGAAVVQVNAGNGQVKEVVHDQEQRFPTRLAYDQANNDLLVVQRGPRVNHVRRYSATDGKLVAVYGRPEGRTYGLFNPLDWDTILDITADGRGGFVTVEKFPRRVAHFRGRDKHALVRQWFGGMQWGALCSLDPADATIVYVFPDHKHCGRGKIDYAARTWTLTHLYELPENFSWSLGSDWHRGMFPPFGSCSYWSVRHVGGATFLVNNGRLYGGEGVSVVRIDEEQQKVVPVARLGVLHPALDKIAQLSWWPAVIERPGYDSRSGCYAWSDTNRNGKIDAEEIVVARRSWGYTESHFYIDEGWNVYRIVIPQLQQFGPPPRKPYDRTQSWAWMVVPNKGKDLRYPSWDWDDAKPSNGMLSLAEFEGISPHPVGIFRDSKGNMYEVCNGENDEKAPDIPPSTWPNNMTGASRFVKWNTAGAREWSVGVHTDSKRRPPGQFAHIRGVLGEVRECLVVLDACSPATVWTRDGLYAGSFLDARAQDDLPDAAYHRIFGDDHHWGQVLETPAGQIIWGVMSDQSTLFYRIEGWDHWERYSGKVTLKHSPRAARAKGSGLSAEYFDDTALRGNPVLNRQDPDIWFGPLWGDHTDVKARNGWFKGGERQRFDPGSCSARWTGFIEPPVSEEFVFVVYAYGQWAGDNNLLGSKVRLWIDGKKVIDEWDQVKFQKVDGRRTRPCHSSKVSLQAGKLVPIKLEYAGTGGEEANLHLYWQSLSLDLRHVPQRYLYPETRALINKP